jgi:hypothetical protein
MGAVAHVQPALDVNAVGDQLVDLSEQRFRIENYAVSNCAPNSRMENTLGI